MQSLQKIFLITGCCLFLAVQAFAYVPCGELLLSLMTERLGQPRGLVVKQTIQPDLSPCEPAGEEDDRLRETVWYHPPGNFRAEVSSDILPNLYVASGGKVVTIFQEAVFSTTENPLMVYKAPLLFRDWESLAGRLSALGVDLSVTSLGRKDGSVAYVIGAQYPDEEPSQFWLAKKTLLPWRLIVRQPAMQQSAETVEVVYSAWRKEGSFQHPGRMEVYRNNILHRVICCEDVSIIRSFADNFFDIDDLRAQYPPVEEAASGAKQTPLNEVERTIDDFRKLYQ